ncbi:biotin transporter BioY [Natronoglycomyces albus]|uniref:Biotin transporter n=1 Tax=Natronoglycomyces albus TaxID=2811108 RepID=A0A895XS84_9ACTN|nr:biotin transporter BioY [Natronoglycomyces albus]QSB06542.1 biotin transporter BioY [Natronoglycomyces albus]
MATQAVAHLEPRVLAEALPEAGRVAAWAREAALVFGGAAAVGISAQVAVPIPFITPVPFVLTTLTVLLLGAAYGPIRAGITIAVYLAVGAAGMPWFSEATSGLGHPSSGYIVGFLLAAIVVGALARRGGDRTFLKTSGLMVVGSLIIYAVGVPYLAYATGMGFSEALYKGMGVFLVTDLMKLLIAAALLPAAWKGVQRLRSDA